MNTDSIPKNEIKLLYVLNIAKRVNNFSYSSMLAAKELGYEFHIAGNWSYTSEAEREEDEEKNGIKIHQIDFIRAPYHPGNWKAYVQLKELVQKEKYDVIHCNTPIGGVLGRLVGRKCKVPKIIYQAHGFHFFKGAPKINWMLFYPIEYWLARYTDVLITINHEDFIFAKNKMKMHQGVKIHYVPGVGIDTLQYSNEKNVRMVKRDELGLLNSDIAIISMGDLIKRKDYETAIYAISYAKNDNLHYYICGTGPEEEKLKMLVKKLGLINNIHFLGYRLDIKELLFASDIFLFTTRQEGLPRSMMEAMACGLPCIASRVRGNVDLLEDMEGGFLCNEGDISNFAEKINLLAENSFIRKEMGRNNMISIRKFSTEVVTNKLKKIYIEEFAKNNSMGCVDNKRALK